MRTKTQFVPILHRPQHLRTFCRGREFIVKELEQREQSDCLCSRTKTVSLSNTSHMCKLLLPLASHLSMSAHVFNMSRIKTLTESWWKLRHWLFLLKLQQLCKKYRRWHSLLYGRQKAATHWPLQGVRIPPCRPSSRELIMSYRHHFCGIHTAITTYPLLHGTQYHSC